jgi:urease accessory protein
VKHVTISETEAAQLDLSFVVRNGRTVLDRRLFRYPYVLMRTFSQPSSSVQDRPEYQAATLTHLVVQNCSGPVHDRDNLGTKLRLGAAADVRVTYQGATAIHRARSGNMSRERLCIGLDPGSRLAYLPEPRILFPDAAHHQTTDIELSAGSTMLFSDAWTLHDPEASGRTFRELDNTLTILRDGEIVLLDRQHLTTL